MGGASNASGCLAIVALVPALPPLYLLGASVPFIAWSPGCLLLDCVTEVAPTPPSQWRWDILGRLLIYGCGVYFLAGLLFTTLDQTVEKRATPHYPQEQKWGLLSHSVLLLEIGFLVGCGALLVGFLLPPPAISRILGAFTD